MARQCYQCPQATGTTFIMESVATGTQDQVLGSSDPQLLLTPHFGGGDFSSFSNLVWYESPCLVTHQKVQVGREPFP